MSSAVTIFSRGALITMSLSLLMGICNYLTRRHLSIHLTTADFGLLYSSFSLFNIIAALTDLGLNNTITLLISSCSRPRESAVIPRLLLKVLIVKTAIFLLVTLIFLLISRPLCLYYFKYGQGLAIFRILTFYCISYQLLIFFMAVLNGFRHFISMNMLQLMFYFFPLLFLVISVNSPMQMTLAIILGEFTGLAVILGSTVFSNRKRLFSIHTVPSRETPVPSWSCLFQTSSWFALGNLTLTIMSCLDVLLLTSQKGVKAAGIYNIAMSISMIITPLTVVSTLAMPIIRSCREKNQLTEIKTLVSFFFSAFSLIFWCGGIFFLLFPKDLITLLFSDDFLAAASSLSLLGPSVLLNMGILFIYGVLSGLNMYSKANLLLLTSIPVNILLNLLLVPHIGLLGAAMGTFGGFFFAAVLMYIHLRLKLPKCRLPFMLNLSGFALTCLALPITSTSLFTRIILFCILSLCLVLVFLQTSDIRSLICLSNMSKGLIHRDE